MYHGSSGHGATPHAVQAQACGLRLRPSGGRPKPDRPAGVASDNTATARARRPGGEGSRGALPSHSRYVGPHWSRLEYRISRPEENVEPCMTAVNGERISARRSLILPRFPGGPSDCAQVAWCQERGMLLVDVRTKEQYSAVRYSCQRAQPARSLAHGGLDLCRFRPRVPCSPAAHPHACGACCIWLQRADPGPQGFISGFVNVPLYRLIEGAFCCPIAVSRAGRCLPACHACFVPSMERVTMYIAGRLEPSQSDQAFGIRAVRRVEWHGAGP